MSTLTNEYVQLQEANRAWEQYHQTQLEQCRQLLSNVMTFDEFTSMEQMAQQILHQFERLIVNNDSNDRIGMYQHVFVQFVDVKS
jgi:hypothetical protein